jgi:hypothetical protein
MFYEAIKDGIGANCDVGSDLRYEKSNDFINNDTEQAKKRRQVIGEKNYQNMQF